MHTRSQVPHMCIYIVNYLFCCQDSRCYYRVLLLSASSGLPPHPCTHLNELQSRYRGYCNLQGDKRPLKRLREPMRQRIVAGKTSNIIQTFNLNFVVRQRSLRNPESWIGLLSNILWRQRDVYMKARCFQWNL